MRPRRIASAHSSRLTSVAPKLAAHADAILLDPKLWARVKAVYEHRDALDPEAKYLTERYHRDFVRAGAELSEADKAQLRALNEEESSLNTEFTQKLLAATKAGALVTEGKEFPDASLIVGAPARVLRSLDDSAAQMIAEAADTYVKRWRRYAQGLKRIG